MAGIDEKSTSKKVIDFIHERYQAGGHDKGWTYIYGRLASRERPEVVTIGLNPGGGRGEAYDWKADAHLAQDGHDSELVNAYFDEPWGANGSFTPLQKQIQLVHGKYFPTTRLNKILSFQFIPFRSPTWAELPVGSYADAIDLGSELLDWTLAKIDSPKLVLGFGLSAVSDRVVKWFDAKHEISVRTGWGKTQAHIYSSPKTQRLVLVPHLSRYRVFGRPAFIEEERVFRGSFP